MDIYLSHASVAVVALVQPPAATISTTWWRGGSSDRGRLCWWAAYSSRLPTTSIAEDATSGALTVRGTSLSKTQREQPPGPSRTVAWRTPWRCLDLDPTRPGLPATVSGDPPRVRLPLPLGGPPRPPALRVLTYVRQGDCLLVRGRVVT
jgi:hypothetical protein